MQSSSRICDHCRESYVASASDYTVRECWVERSHGLLITKRVSEDDLELCGRCVLRRASEWMGKQKQRRAEVQSLERMVGE